MTMLLSAVAGQGGVKVPGAPGTLSLSNGSTSGTMINLSWSAPSDTGGGTISGYKIQRSTNSGVSWSDLVADTGGTGTTYTNTGLTRLTRYDYRVAAINEKGTGAYGNEPNHTTTAEVPGAPGTLSLSAGSSPDTIIDLSWSAPSDTGGATVTGYRIKKDGSVLVADTGSTATTYSATGLTASTSYSFTVAAINSIGTGADGNTPSLTTGAAFAYSTTGSPASQTHGSYTSLTWTGSGSMTVTAGTKTVDVLVVAGGGGGGGGGIASGGGGGGGFVTESEALSTTSGSSGVHTVTIGAGGGAANNGNNSLFTGVTTATYGARGGGASYEAEDGGCGGGGDGYHNTVVRDGGAGSQGGDGGSGKRFGTWYFASGGGGGAGENGDDRIDGTSATSPASANGTGGQGGDGTANAYRTGSNVTYAGGGGGCAADSVYNIGVVGEGGDGGGGRGSRWGGSTHGWDAAVSGTANTGGGGGGMLGGSAGTGGSGIVVVRFLT